MLTSKQFHLSGLCTALFFKACLRLANRLAFQFDLASQASIDLRAKPVFLNLSNFKLVDFDSQNSLASLGNSGSPIQFKVAELWRHCSNRILENVQRF